MSSLSFLELLALGDDLPVDWRSLIPGHSEERPLLFRWLEFCRIPPEELALHFLIPMDWRTSRRELVVVDWLADPVSHGDRTQRVIPADMLPYFRIYRLVPGQRIPQPVQVDHSHFHPELRRVG